MDQPVMIPAIWFAYVGLAVIVIPFILRAVGHVFPRVSAVGLRIFGDLKGAWDEARGAGVIQASFKQQAADKKGEPRLPDLPVAKP